MQIMQVALLERSFFELEEKFWFYIFQPHPKSTDAANFYHLWNGFQQVPEVNLIWRPYLSASNGLAC